ncbi:hypothetical protein CR513_21989, partial [Mucuna pruriens]
MKEEKITTNLYTLLGETLQVANASVATSSQEEATMMWYHRLGHMFEQGLKVLVECNLMPGLKMESSKISMGGVKYFVSFIDDYSKRL